MESGILSLGPIHKEFEKKFARAVGTKYAASVSSGTAGLHLAMIAAGIGAGDEVITTPFSFVASANSILYVGAKPIFVDIDEQTFNIDAAKIEGAITKKTKAILVVHIFGQTCDMDAITEIAEKHNLKIIEDSCESLFAKYKGRHAGTFGETSVFAFYPNKQITTGEGGMVVTDDEKAYEFITSLRNQGRSPDMQWLDHKYLGYNYRMDEMSAALGSVQLDRAEYLLNERRKLAEAYNKILPQYSDALELPCVAPENEHTWFVYVVKVKQGIDRDELIRKMAKEGVATKPYLPSIHLFEFYKKRLGFKAGDYPVSESASRRTLALPFYIGLKEEDLIHICKRLATNCK